VPVLLFWSIAGAVLAMRDRTRHVLIVALLWCVAYAVFLPFAQMVSVPSFALDLRILTPLFAGLVIVAAASADAAMRERRRLLAIVLLLPLVLAAARGAKVMLAPHPQPVADCVSRSWYVDAIRRAAPTGTIVSNAQGTVWLALRRPVLARGAAETYVWIDPAIACSPVVEEPGAPPPAGVRGERGLVIAPQR
jgi:hypothetical protein